MTGSNGSNGNGNGNGAHPPASRQHEQWKSTDGQKGFILRLVNENGLDKTLVEEMAQSLFGVGVRALSDCVSQSASAGIPQLCRPFRLRLG